MPADKVVAPVKKMSETATIRDLETKIQAAIKDRYPSKKNVSSPWLADVLLNERAVVIRRDDGTLFQVGYDIDDNDGIVLVGDEIEVTQKYIPQYAEEIETGDLLGQEIFMAGAVETPEYSVADIEHLVENSKKLKDEVKPPVFLGHTRQHGWPAVGWVENLRREGATLIGDLKRVPKVICDWVKAGGYRRVSAEIMPDYIGEDGKNHGNVFWGIGLLGQDIPRLKLLKDLPIPVYDDGRGVQLFDFDVQKGTITSKRGKEGVPMTTERTDMISLEPARYAELLEREKIALDKASKAAQYAEEIKGKDAQIEAQGKEIADLKAKVSASEQKFSDQRKAVKAAKIDSAISALTSEGKITPAEVPAIRAYCESTSDDVVIKFADGDKAPENSQMDFYLRGLQARPKGSAVNFAVVSTTGKDEPAKDDAAAEADLSKRANEYADKHPGISYAASVKAVWSKEDEARTTGKAV